MAADGPCNWDINTGCVEGWDELPATAQLIGYNLATFQLWALTGRRYGQCEITVQPCQERRKLPLYLTYPVPGVGFYGGYGGSGGFGPVIEDGTWYNRCWSGCRCKARCETALDGPTTTAGILEVTVKGEVIDPAAYQVQDNYQLVRIDGQCWPTCVDYSKQDPPEFTVTYLRGDEVPDVLEIAGGILANEYALACISSDDCRLPTRLQSLSRQGVSVQVAASTTYLDFGMTQIAEVDQVVIALNPYRLTERPRVLSPDRPRPRQVT